MSRFLFTGGSVWSGPVGGGSSKFSGGVPPNLGGFLQNVGGVPPNFGGVLQIFGGGFLQIFGGVPPNFWGGFSKFLGGSSKFSGGVPPNFQGGVSKFFFLFFFQFLFPKKILLGCTNPPSRRSMRGPVRILLECILVFTSKHVKICLHVPCPSPSTSNLHCANA